MSSNTTTLYGDRSRGIAGSVIMEYPLDVSIELEIGSQEMFATHNAWFVVASARGTSPEFIEWP